MSKPANREELRGLARLIDAAWVEYHDLEAAGKSTVNLVDTIRRMEQSLYDCTTRLLDAAEENERLRRSVEILPKLDCRYTAAGVADSGGDHCPTGDKCERCKREADVERLREALDIIHARVCMNPNSPLKECPDEYGLAKRDTHWCSSCIARSALRSAKGEVQS